MSKNKEKPIKQENREEIVHKWSMLDGYTYFTFETKRSTSCKSKESNSFTCKNL